MRAVLLVVTITASFAITPGHLRNEHQWQWSVGTSDYGFRGLWQRLAACADSMVVGNAQPGHQCIGAVYVWAPSMPLSEIGIGEVREAMAGLRIPLVLVPASDLESRLTNALWVDPKQQSPEHALVRSIAAAGGLAHFPALVIFRSGISSATAILGFKTAMAYRLMIRTISTER